MNKIEKGPAFWKAFGQAAALWAAVAVVGSLLLPGGSIDKKEWLKGFEKPEKLPLLLNKYGQKVYNAAIAAQMSFVIFLIAINTPIFLISRKTYFSF